MNRIFHTWDKWECYPAGFYESKKEGVKDEDARAQYKEFLSDIPRFESAMSRLFHEWPNSCEHYLTNEGMNRLAWLGQAAACIDSGLPSRYKGGYYMLSKEEQLAADTAALKYLNIWLSSHGHDPVDSAGAGSRAKVNLY